MREQKWSMLCLFAWCILPVFGALPAHALPLDFPWRATPLMERIEQGTLLESSLLTAGNLLECGPITAMGRYRVTLRARYARLGGNALVLQAWERRDDGENGPLIASTSMSGYLATAPMTWQTFTLDFDVEQGKTIIAGVMLTSGRGNTSGALQIEQASLSLDKPEMPVFLSYALSRKLRYKHHEQGTVDVRLTNASSVRQTVELRPVIVDDTGERTTGKPVSFTVQALTTITGSLPFALSRQDGGFEVLVEAWQHGKIIDRKSGDVFCVSDNPFQFAIQSDLHVPYLLSASGPLTTFQQLMTTGWTHYVDECRRCIAVARKQDYPTYSEYFAWAKEDASLLTADTDAPYLAGQTCYSVSRKQLRMLNALFREQGIAPAADVNAYGFGWPGFEVMRENPEWFNGADFSVDLWEKYLKNDRGAAAGYPHLAFNFDARSAVTGMTFLEYHIDQLLKSADMYGWEAVRYDAGTMPAKYYPAVKKALAAHTPPIGIGSNLGVFCLGNQQNDDWKTYASDGSWMMEEGINGAFRSPTSPYHSWSAWIALLKRGTYLTNLNGGFYTYINGSGNWLSTALGFAAGGHSWSTHPSPYANYNRFMVHYGYYFWDRRTRYLENPEQVLQVSSSKPVWWKELAHERQLDGSHRQLIIPLFNPPAGATVDDIRCAGPAEDVVVKYTPKPGEKVTAFVLAPEPEAQMISTATVQPDGVVAVAVPRFWGWSNVVFDCR